MELAILCRVREESSKELRKSSWDRKKNRRENLSFKFLQSMSKTCLYLWVQKIVFVGIGVEGLGTEVATKS